MKIFTVDEAQSLLPVLESLLKRAIEGKRAAEEAEAGLQELSRQIYFAGGMRVDVAAAAKMRAEVESHLASVREMVAPGASVNWSWPPPWSSWGTKPVGRRRNSTASARQTAT